MRNQRHFTATGFIVHNDHIALHWHKKVQAWLPPGGHINENEDPVQAVIREIREETGLEVAIVPTNSPFQLNYPRQIQTPVTIMIEEINDPSQGPHQHIDMIYYCRIIGNVEQLQNGWHWVNNKQLAEGVALEYQLDKTAVPPQDVRVLGQHAIKFVSTGDFF